MRKTIPSLGLFLLSATLLAQSNLRVFPSDYSQTEFSITVSPQDPNRLLIGANSVSASGSKYQGYYYSSNGGQSWGGGNALPWGAVQQFSADPSVSFDSDGNAYFCFIGTQNVRNPNRVLVIKSTDGGVNWPTPPIEIPTTTPTTSHFDKPYLAVDNNVASPFYRNVYVAYTADFAIRFVRSTDRGSTFLPQADGLLIGGPDRGLNAVPVVLPNGDVIVIWNILPDGYAATAIVQNKSTNGGVSFSGSPTTITGVTQIGTRVGESFRLKITPSNPEGVRADNYPSIAVDRSNGAIYVVFTDIRPGPIGSNTPDIFLIKSTNEGDTWSSVVRVNDVTNGDQWSPWVCVDDAGAINVLFYDSRIDPSNLATQVYFARSTDGGLTFANHPLSSVTFIPAPVGRGTEPGYAGD